MKKFIIVLAFALASVSCFGLTAQVISINDKTGVVCVTGVASNISDIILYSWPAHCTLTVYDAYSTALVDGTSNTLCVINDQAIAYINASKSTYPIVLDMSRIVVFNSASNFFTPVKPFSIFPTALKGIVFKIDAGINSVTAQFFVTQE